MYKRQDWRISTALITGFMAKESVVSALLILFGSEAALSAALTPVQAAPLLVFCQMCIRDRSWTPPWCWR